MFNIFYAILVLSIFGLQKTLGDHNEDTWIEPNAWGREAPGWRQSILQGNEQLAECPVCERVTAPAITEEGVTILLYKKFIANLFNRQKLQYNKEAALYHRTLHLSLQPDQLEKLEQLSDPRDLDSVLSDVIKKARSCDEFKSNVDSSMGITVIVLDIVKDFLELLKTSEIRFTLIVVAAILLGWYLHRRYKIGIISIILSSFLLLGYFITYLECNRKLEIDEVIEFMNENANQQTEPSWYSPILNLFSSDNRKNADIEKLKKSRKIKLRFCRPDHVLMIYANDIFMKQFEFLIEKFTSTMSTFSNTLPFPYNLLAPLLLIILIGYVLKLTYKYILSPKAWASLLHHNTQQHSHLSQQALPHHSIAEDRISGENLKILLNAIKSPSILVTNGHHTSAPAVSGVEEVLEQIEAKEITPNTSQSEQNKLVSDNNNEDKAANETKSKVTLEDSLDGDEK